MSPAAALLSDFRRRGILLVRDGANLRFRAPVGALTPEDRAALKEYKADLLAFLTALAVLADFDPEPVEVLPAGSWQLAYKAYLARAVTRCAAPSEAGEAGQRTAGATPEASTGLQNAPEGHA
jgi:hypothetical protein